MKQRIKTFSLILALIMLLSALPLTVHAEEYPRVQRAFFREGGDGSLKAMWTVDYTGLSDDVRVLHRVTFYKAPRHGSVNYKE